MKRFNPMNPMRQRIVFFEGLDKAGKSTLCRRARFESGHDVLMFDRGFVGRRVFQQFRMEQEFPIHDWNMLELKLISVQAVGVIFLRIPPQVSFQRISASGEKPEFTLEDLEDQAALYEREILRLKEMSVPVLEINTSEQVENVSLNHILEWIKGGRQWI